MQEHPPIKERLPAADCWFLTGATATGKTKIGVELARRLNAEIISLDSMAVYRGMDIGTAKPSPDEQAAIRHHLIDIRNPEEEFSIAEYVAAANCAIAEIDGRDRTVLFVGGTPLYLKGLLRGLFDGPEADWEFRRAIEEEIEEVGHDALFQRVQQIDPVAASQLHPNDTRRLIRVLEVFKQTGEPISHHQLQFDEGRPADSCRVFALRRERDAMHGRIAERVDRMFETGMVDEVRRLTSGDHHLGRTASQAVGYREVCGLLAGQIDLPQAIEQTKTRTRRFAKRQGTWFRSLSECRFADVAETDDYGHIAAKIEAAGESVGPTV